MLSGSIFLTLFVATTCFVDSLTTPQPANMSGGRKESILDLKPLVDKKVHVKLAGGREGAIQLATHEELEVLFEDVKSNLDAMQWKGC